MSYQEASTIFFQLATNKVLAGNLLKSDKQSNQEKLTYEVKKLLDNHKIDWRNQAKIKPVEKQIKEPVVYSFQPTFSTQPNQQTNSPLKDRVLNERKALYLKRGHLHGRLHEAETDDARYDLAYDLFMIQQKIDEYNRDLRQIEAGDIPVRYLATTATGAEVTRRRNLKIYIARIKKELPIVTDSKKHKGLLGKLQEYESELENL